MTCLIPSGMSDTRCQAGRGTPSVSLQKPKLCTHHKTPWELKDAWWVSALSLVQVEGDAHFSQKGVLPRQAL